jgi:hypothetical protein
MFWRRLTEDELRALRAANGEDLDQSWWTEVLGFAAGVLGIAMVVRMLVG